jgi:hypothetical protein
MSRTSATKPAGRKNLTKVVRNQITEMHDEGKSASVIASECGIAIEKVEAAIAAYAAGDPTGGTEPAPTRGARAAAAKLAAAPEAPAADAPEAPEAPAEPTPAPAKPATSPSRNTREPGYTGKGIRLFGVREDGVDDLGVWGDVFSAVAVDEYEAAHQDSRYVSYLACPMRNTWLIASGPAAE